MPKPHILRKADEKNIPILLVTMDTYQVAMQINKIESLITNENNKLENITDTINEHIDIEELLK